MVALSFLVLCSVILRTLASPSSSQPKGVIIVAPPKPKNTKSIPIPDPAHPFIKPQHGDRRGPCPALNTLANHGYLPRSGIASFEQIVNATTHAFNMDYTLSSALTAFGVLARGNAFVDGLSIGLQSPDVPPLPGKIDGPVARGLASHGRVEGDVSMTRQDAAIGDNVNFQEVLFDQLLALTAQLGNDSTVTGPHSIVNIPVMQEFKFKRFLDSQVQDKQLEYHVGRLILSYGEASFALNFFANGTEGTLSVPTMTSFFRNQRFPDNWHRRSSPGTIEVIGQDSDAIFNAHPVPPGANDASGVYIPDPPSDGCALYNGLAGLNVPAVLLNTTGILKTNVDFLLDTIHNLFPECPVVIPSGQANV